MDENLKRNIGLGVIVALVLSTIILIIYHFKYPKITPINDEWKPSSFLNIKMESSKISFIQTNDKCFPVAQAVTALTGLPADTPQKAAIVLQKGLDDCDVYEKDDGFAIDCKDNVFYFYDTKETCLNNIEKHN